MFISDFPSTEFFPTLQKKNVCYTLKIIFISFHSEFLGICGENGFR